MRVGAGCTSGITELAGTGFEGHGATTWLTTSAPVTGGSTFTLDFGIMDANDAIYSSAVLVDNLDWDAEQGILETKRAD